MSDRAEFAGFAMVPCCCARLMATPVGVDAVVVTDRSRIWIPENGPFAAIEMPNEVPLNFRIEESGATPLIVMELGFVFGNV